MAMLNISKVPLFFFQNDETWVVNSLPARHWGDQPIKPAAGDGKIASWFIPKNV